MFTEPPHSAISDGGRAFDISHALAPDMSPDNVLSWLTHLAPPHILPFEIMSSEGSWHAAHVDASGYGTLVNMIRGSKVFLLGVPKHAKVPMPPHKDTSWDLMSSDDIDLFLIALRKSDSL